MLTLVSLRSTTPKVLAHASQGYIALRLIRLYLKTLLITQLTIQPLEHPPYPLVWGILASASKGNPYLHTLIRS